MHVRARAHAFYAFQVHTHNFPSSKPAKTQPPTSQHEQPAKPKVASIFGAFDDDLLG